MVATLKDVDVTSPRSGVSIVSFRGEHDVTSSQSTAELLDSLLLANHLVIADVSEAKFVDASMLEVLIETDNAARERRTDFRVRLGTEPIIQRLFQISGVLEQVSCASSMDEALEDPDKHNSVGGKQRKPYRISAGGTSEPQPPFSVQSEREDNTEAEPEAA